MNTDQSLFSFFVISDFQLTYKDEISHRKLSHALEDLHEIDPDASWCELKQTDAIMA